MNRCMDEAVELARLEAHQVSLNKEPQDIARLIPAAIEEMGALGDGRARQVSIPESLPLAECDKDMVRRVLKQLLQNALKYSPEDSRSLCRRNSTELPSW